MFPFFCTHFIPFMPFPPPYSALSFPSVLFFVPFNSILLFHFSSLLSPSSSFLFSSFFPIYSILGAFFYSFPPFLVSVLSLHLLIPVFPLFLYIFFFLTCLSLSPFASLSVIPSLTSYPSIHIYFLHPLSLCYPFPSSATSLYPFLIPFIIHAFIFINLYLTIFPFFLSLLPPYSLC